MPRTRAGDVSRLLKASAIRLLGATVDDKNAPLYLKVQAARSLLQVKPEPKPADDEDEFPAGGSKVIILAHGETYRPAEGFSKVIVLPQKDEALPGEGSGKVIVLPSNGRENIAADRQRDRLARLAALPITDDDDEPEPLEVPAPAAPVKKLTGRERLRRLRARCRAARDADFEA